MNLSIFILQYKSKECKQKSVITKSIAVNLDYTPKGTHTCSQLFFEAKKSWFVNCNLEPSVNTAVQCAIDINDESVVAVLPRGTGQQSKIARKIQHIIKTVVHIAKIN